MGRQVEHSSAMDRLARLGYGARGVVYLVVGGLAVDAAFGGGGKTTGSKGALTTVLQQPFGKFLLGLLALGLVGYSVWRFVQSVKDVDGHGTDVKGLAIRGGLFVSALSHLFLAFYAAALLFSGYGGGGGGGNDSAAWTARLMQVPFGRWLVGLVGVAVIGAGIANMAKGWKAGFEKFMSLPSGWLHGVCRFGLVARGVVFGLIGAFFVVAAVRFDPQEARGLGGTLQTLRSQAYGPFLLGIVALGLVAFGVYSILEMRYRRVG